MHRLTTRTIAQLFAGPIDESAMAEIRASQHSRRLLLLKAVHELVGNSEAWTVLLAADRRRRDIVREILTYPAVGTWLVGTVRTSRGLITDDVPLSTHLAHLGSVAAAAAIRTGTPATVTVPVWHDSVALPTIGRFRVTGGGPFVQLRNAPSGVQLKSNADAPWTHEVSSSPLRRHRSTAGGLSIDWTIDDVDPYREAGVIDPPTGLDANEFDRWYQLLDEAWAILVHGHGRYARELAAADTVIVPLSADGEVIGQSSVSSFGAIMLALPSSATTLAETLIHELQHSKLNALLDLAPLGNKQAGGLYHAPWRADPRPLNGLLHGIYAFTSVAEFWSRQRRLVDTVARRDANLQAAFRWHQVNEALRSIDGERDLTALGQRFLAATVRRLTGCAVEDLPEDVAELPHR
jgi:HEXXH motif-containing protein